MDRKLGGLTSLLFLAACIGGCATMPSAPTRNPSITVKNFPAQDAIGRLIKGCIATNGAIEPPAFPRNVALK